MKSRLSTTKRKWFAKSGWALVLALIGVLMIAFVVATRGAYAAWILWIAVPLLMISLGFLYLVNAVAAVWGENEQHQDEPEQEKGHHEG